MACGCGSSGQVCKFPGRRVKRVSPRQQAEAAMRVALGTKEGRDRLEYQWVDAAKKHGGVRVVWLGVRWIGVPWPVRWLFIWGTGVNVRKLEGCGCLLAGKVVWKRAKRKVLGFLWLR